MDRDFENADSETGAHTSQQSRNWKMSIILDTSLASIGLDLNLQVSHGPRIHLHSWQRDVPAHTHTQEQFSHTPWHTLNMPKTGTHRRWESPSTLLVHGQAWISILQCYLCSNFFCIHGKQFVSFARHGDISKRSNRHTDCSTEHILGGLQSHSTLLEQCKG